MNRLPNGIIDVQLCPATIVADRVRQHDRAQPPPARGAGIATRLIHLLECRCLFLSSLMMVAGLTCNTRAVSRIPTVPIALLAFRRRAMAHNIRALAVGAWSTCVIIVARYHTGGSVPLRHPSRMADQQICNTFQIFW